MKNNYWHEFAEDHYYHVYNHSVGEKDIFSNPFDCKDFINRYIKYLNPYFSTIGYCLMRNHFHFLVKVRQRKQVLEFQTLTDSTAIENYKMQESNINDVLLDQLRRLFSSYSLAYNFRHKSRGQLFVKRCKRVCLPEEKVISMLCYIHHNPIHHRFTSDYHQWESSSYPTYMSRSINKLIDFRVFEELNGKKDNFQALHEEYKTNRKDSDLG